MATSHSHAETQSALGQTTLAPPMPGSGGTTTPSSISMDPEKAAAISGANSITSGEQLPTGEKTDANVNPAPGAESPVRTITGVKWFLVCSSILSSIFLFALDNTIVADVQPKVIERFNSIEKLPWLSVAFLLGAVATNLTWGKMYGQFNAKYLYLICVFLFEVGSAICGAANSMDMLIIGRAIAGLGGAGLYIGVMTLLSFTTSPHERPIYIGMTGLTWGAGTVGGPLVGGALAESPATWRWAFYINLVIGAVVAPIYIFLIPSIDPRPNIPQGRRWLEIDYVGTLLIMGALISGSMAISFGGTLYEWDSGRIIGLFVCSGVLFILFGFQQVFLIFTTLERRLFPVHFLRSRTMLILFCMTASAVTVAFVPLYFLPLFFQFVRNDSAVEAGVRLLPFVVFLVVLVIVNGALMSKFGYYMPYYLIGGALAIIGSALMYTIDVDSSPARLYGYTIILGAGSGLYIQASFSVAQAKVPLEETSTASSFISLAQIGGATIALAIANSVFLNQSTKKITQILPDTSIDQVRTAIAGRGSQFFGSLSEEKKAQVLKVIVDAIGRVYILALTAGCMAFILAIFLKREKLFMTAAGGA
ncbi:MAG: hypothetical protein M1823_004772 [Watsoniomyces obsoletus]|nr:MAG: hypothetical protein M1823_004772 [Watsoniomyces obsoletus]